MGECLLSVVIDTIIIQTIEMRKLRISNLSMVTQLPSEKLRIKTQVVWFSSS